jgi:AhpD family alkylhydroperoxidase
VRELVILRVAHLQRSDYEVLQHEAVASRIGVDEAQLAALRGSGYLTVNGFDADERVILSSITELLVTKRMSNSSFERIHDLLEDEATVELLMWVSLYAGLALVLNATEVDIDTSARFEPTA